ncbi:kip1 ubiquitination-promoting complex subunit 2 isoform X1 [Megachile rotundata]|uniref:kip1 ubiquitination-promoting complex subunit 2 isoform X1 n=1 Tax=Megachile rotundata TaxID=143995 RepID=UPI000258F5DC|nr:PREDICTED: ubiquitin-associated domain-containing protein 1-like isoform X1 [Megachile rotundata]XP_012152112.1 PREDICTED: ubiquitin-associated domain-containing protein 1-like isoform X1 [Megachile rotundata]
MLLATSTSPKNFSVNVISLEGNITDVTVNADFTIEKIKIIVIKHFYGNDIAKTSSQFRLIHSSKFKQLVDTNSVNDEEINEHDELMLMRIRPVRKENLSEDTLKGPSEEAIMQATNDLPICNPHQHISSAYCSVDFQNEIRKILITLVKASAKILMYSSNIEKFYEILKDKLEAKCKPTIDPNTVKVLMEMGYSHKRVIKALCLRKSNISEALEWLIEHQDDSDNDDDLHFLIEKDNDKVVAGSSLSNSTRRRSLKEMCIELFKAENPSMKKQENLVNIVDLLLESFHFYKKMDFKPNSKAMQSLLEMGFEEKGIINALKITGNNQINACEWLLGERRHSLQDLNEGFDTESPIFKAIMNNSHIQLSLTSPKMLLVYLSILETPVSINMWLSDPEVSPILNQIIKTYHAEKHAIHINQYMTN